MSEGKRGRKGIEKKTCGRCVKKREMSEEGGRESCRGEEGGEMRGCVKGKKMSDTKEGRKDVEERAEGR